jgi:hypothetical protein
MRKLIEMTRHLYARPANRTSFILVTTFINMEGRWVEGGGGSGRKLNNVLMNSP